MRQIQLDASVSAGDLSGPVLSEGALAAPSDQVAPPQREPMEPMLAARLVISRGPGIGGNLPITARHITIGRNPTCDIVLDDSTISGHHARIDWEDGDYVLSDGTSLNGVYVNRRPVQRARLVDGDEVWIGKARFVFRSRG